MFVFKQVKLLFCNKLLYDQAKYIVKPQKVKYSMSQWHDMHFQERIRTILGDIQYCRPDHHMAPPFLTAYQIAIEFAQRYPDDFQRTGLQIGGRGIGEHNSLAQYIAHELSTRIGNREIQDIEGSFLSNKHLTELSFVDFESAPITSSLTESQYDLSMFRLRPN